MLYRFPFVRSHTRTISTILTPFFLHFVPRTRLLWLMFLGWFIAVIHSIGPFGSLLLHVSHRLARQLIVFYILNSYFDEWLTSSLSKWWPIDHLSSNGKGRPYRTLGGSGGARSCLCKTHPSVLFSLIIFRARVRLIAFLPLLDSFLSVWLLCSAFRWWSRASAMLGCLLLKQEVSEPVVVVVRRP